MNALILKVKTWWKNFWLPSPKEFKIVNSFSTAVLAIIPTLASGITGINNPVWFTNYAWYIFAIASALLLWSKSHIVK